MNNARPKSNFYCHSIIVFLAFYRFTYSAVTFRLSDIVMASNNKYKVTKTLIKFVVIAIK